MKKLMGLLLALALVMAACGDDDAADPASLDSCDAIATAGIDLLQSTRDEIDALNTEEQSALLTSDEEPAFVTELEARGTALEARAAEINCTDEQIGELMFGKFDRLSAESTVGQLFLGFFQEAVTSGELFSSN